MKENKAIIAQNETTGEVKKFKSMNAAARDLGAQFSEIQRSTFSGGLVRGWRIYGSPEQIHSQIEILQKRLEKVKELL